MLTYLQVAVFPAKHGAVCAAMRFFGERNGERGVDDVNRQQMERAATGPNTLVESFPIKYQNAGSIKAMARFCVELKRAEYLQKKGDG